MKLKKVTHIEDIPQMSNGWTVIQKLDDGSIVQTKIGKHSPPQPILQSRYISEKERLQWIADWIAATEERIKVLEEERGWNFDIEFSDTEEDDDENDDENDEDYSDYDYDYY